MPTLPELTRWERFQPASRFASLLLIPAFVMLYIKHGLMTGVGGYRVATRALGRIEDLQYGADDRSSYFSWSERLSFYRSDLVIGCILLPLAAILLALLVPRRLRGWVFGGAAVVMSLTMVAAFRIFGQVGRFPSKEILADAIRFGQHSNDTAGDYLNFSTAFIIKLSALFAAVLVLTVWAAYYDRRRALLGRPARYAFAAASLGIVGLTAWSWLPWLPYTAYHRSVLASMANAWSGDQPGQSAAWAGLPPEELVRQFRDMTGTPQPRHDPRYWGKARDYDVLLFVLETAPAKCLALDGDLKRFPTMARLREQSWIGTRHHSTYPYTSRAVFSILTSWYPSSLSVDFTARLPNTPFPGVMRSLKNEGYQTAAYAPDTFTRITDDTMFASVGIQKRYYSDVFATQSSSKHPIEKKIELDRLALQALKDDIAHWHKSNQRFAAIIQPQIGHGPWPDLTGGNQEMIARGTALIALQDEWLGEIVQQLERANRLDKTIIVVTGDHGIRTRAEDPAFEGGMIEDYSFHVPALVYAPSVLTARQDISWLTSHIDLAPSVLDLLGVFNSREFEQGAPIWDDRLKERTLFFLAGHYGSDGYYQPNQPFAMWNRFSDMVYSSDRLDFRKANLHATGSPTYQTVADKLSRMISLQEAWAGLPKETSASVSATASAAPGGWSQPREKR